MSARRIWLLTLFALASCAPIVPATTAMQSGSGRLAVAVELPSLDGFSGFFSQAETSEVAPCATLAYVRARLTELDSQPPVTLESPTLNIADAKWIEMSEVPAGTYELVLDIISAAEVVVFSGTDTIKIRADDQSLATVMLEQVGGCPRPKPEPLSILEFPDKTGCSSMVFTGNKQKFSIVVDASTLKPLKDYREPGMDTTAATDWVIKEPLTTQNRQLGFNVQAAWADAVTLTSTKQTSITINYASEMLCFDPYLPGGNFVHRNDAVVDLTWEAGSPDTLAGIAVIAYRNGRQGSYRPTVDGLTTDDIVPSAEHGVLLEIITDTAVTTTSVTLPDPSLDWSVHLFTIEHKSTNTGYIAFDTGAVWLPAQSSGAAPMYATER